MCIDEEVNQTKLAPLLLISIVAFAVFSGVSIALTSNINAIKEATLFKAHPQIIRMPSVSAVGVPVFSADPISDPKPN